jgi:hypothetical protein
MREGSPVVDGSHLPRHGERGGFAKLAYVVVLSLLIEVVIVAVLGCLLLAGGEIAWRKAAPYSDRPAGLVEVKSAVSKAWTDWVAS